jgi:hypothetical protein
VWIGDQKARFALEYEHSLKSYRRYDRIRDALHTERQVGCILYLTSGMEVLLHLVQELQSVPRILAFANAASFRQMLLETKVITGRNLAGTEFPELLQWNILGSLPFHSPLFALLMRSVSHRYRLFGARPTTLSIQLVLSGRILAVVRTGMLFASRCRATIQLHSTVVRGVSHF